MRLLMNTARVPRVLRTLRLHKGPHKPGSGNEKVIGNFNRVVIDGQDTSGTFRFTRVWVNRNGMWQTVAFQETTPR